ncbi:MAG: hypothetical protein HY050_00340 [Actinobacteria bacterium]|nr:hypothetical protein [Actinomycetota bacterium]
MSSDRYATTRKLGVAVISIASSIVASETEASLEEMIFRTTKEALSKVGMTAEDIDGVVLGGNDQIDGRVISIMPSAGPAGGVNHDTTMIASSGDHALIYGYLRILAGQSKRVMVVGWAKPSESIDPDRVELMSAEPYLLRPIGMNETLAAALQASRLLGNGTPKVDNAHIVAWPLTRKDLPARGDSVFVAILAEEESFDVDTELAWVMDAGWSTASYELGARDLADFESLKLACNQIARRTPNASAENWDAVEIGAPSEYAVAAAAKTLAFGAGITVNASGPLREQLTSPFVLGLSRMIRAIEAVKRIGTTDKEVLIAGIGFNGFAGQGAAVMIFSSNKEGKND